jgi:hypothetical protein
MVVRIADARHQAISFEVAQQGMHSLRSIDRRRPSAAWLAAPRSARALSTMTCCRRRAVPGHRLADEASGRRGHLARQPAGQLPHAARRVVFGMLGVGRHAHGIVAW